MSTFFQITRLGKSRRYLGIDELFALEFSSRSRGSRFVREGNKSISLCRTRRTFWYVRPHGSMRLIGCYKIEEQSVIKLLWNATHNEDDGW
jgi:hypothetical protein